MAAAGGFVDLHESVDVRNSECLNQSSAHPLNHCLENGLRDDPAVYLESDCDEQLLISIPLKQPCRIQSIILAGLDDGTAPKDIKIFVNNLHMDFDSAMSTTPAHATTLTSAQVEGGPIEVKFVRFQRVEHLTIFIENNQDGGEVTRVRRLAVIGDTIHKTNMSELKPTG